jgi:hypothetical protein
VADVGESLVGSYLRYIVGCDIVAYNTHTPTVQGELDVIGIRTVAPRTVWLCEVVTHLRGTLYAGGYSGTIEKIRDKIGRARDFALATFDGDVHRYEIWSPIVPSGVAVQFEALAAEFSTQELDVEFVINSRYTERVEQLVAHARSSTKATNEPAYRLLQILTHLRGELRV